VNDDERRVRSLPARALSDVLTELASINESELRGGPVRSPRVSLHLGSGRELEGVVVHFTRERGNESISIQTGTRSRHEAARDITYVPLAAIEAITVYEAGAGQATRRDRGGFGAVIEPPPTRLAARRAPEQHKKRAIDTVGRDIEWSAPIDELEGEALRSLLQLSSDAVDALTHVARDELGRAALSERVARVAFQNAGGGQVAREGDRLVFFASFAEGDRGRLAPESLRTALDALL
jgi:hypothetical protein